MRTIQFVCRSIGWGLIGAILGLAAAAPAAVVNISVVNFAFTPAATNISLNDTVVWTWVPGANNHNVRSTSAPQAWTSSAIANGPFSFTNTFTNTGTFPYECSVHLFTGSITVSNATPPPTISITNPVNNAVFAAPANVKLGAAVSASVTNVEYFGNGNSLGSSAASPFNITASDLAANAYALTAVATAGGVSTTSAVVNISVVSPSAVSLSLPQFATGQFVFDYSANIGLRYVVESSSNLVDWLPVITNTAVSNPAHFTNNSATNSDGFYRVGRLPNP